MAQNDMRKRTSTQTENLEQQIRNRAYELYEGRGREDGHDLEDWFRAEIEITQQNTRTIAA
jgi:hypothetical protein